MTPILSNFSFLPLNANIADFKASHISAGKLLCVTYDVPFKLFISNDYGETWQEIQNPILSGSYPRIRISDVDDQIIFISSSQSIYRSVDGGYNWDSVTPSSNLTGWQNVSIKGNTVVVSRADNLSFQATLFKSIDLGDTWTDITPSNTYFGLGLLINDLDANNIFAHGAYKYDQIGNTIYIKEYLYVSHDGGLSFDQINPCRNPPPNPPGYEICYAQYHSFFVDKHSGNVFAASNSGLYISQDKGLTWIHVPSLSESYVPDVIIVKNIAFKSGYELKVSYDNLNSWESINVYNEGNLVESRRLDFSGSFVYFSSYYGLYRAEIYN